MTARSGQRRGELRDGTRLEDESFARKQGRVIPPLHVGAEVEEVQVAPNAYTPPAYGVIAEICSGCDEVLIRCYNGHEERVQLDRIGEKRPQARWRLTGGRPL